MPGYTRTDTPTAIPLSVSRLRLASDRPPTSISQGRLLLLDAQLMHPLTVVSRQMGRCKGASKRSQPRTGVLSCVIQLIRRLSQLPIGASDNRSYRKSEATTQAVFTALGEISDTELAAST